MGHVRLFRSCECLTSVEDDAKSESGGEIYGELRLRARRGAFLFVRTLDFASVRRQVVLANSARARDLAVDGYRLRGDSDRDFSGLLLLLHSILGNWRIVHDASGVGE